MLNKSIQISLYDIYSGVLSSTEDTKPELISLLDEHIDFDSLLSHHFRHAFYTPKYLYLPKYKQAPLFD